MAYIRNKKALMVVGGFMESKTLQLQFSTRKEFRDWLKENASIGQGVWLVFGKTKDVNTLSANDALEEALCFGWIDGQMKSIDSTRYQKYFTKRNKKSVWSEKNRKKIDDLRNRGLMTPLGEQTIEEAKRNGMWDTPKANSISNEQINEFVIKLKDYPIAYENFIKMSPSVKRTYTTRYLSFKTEEARNRDFTRIVDRLTNNLKPM